MKKPLIFIFLLLLGCSGKGIKYEIINESGVALSAIELGTSEYSRKIRRNTLEPNERISGFLNMKEEKFDGCYLLSFEILNERFSEYCYGYFTNGSPSGKNITFMIFKDTVLFDEELKLY